MIVTALGIDGTATVVPPALPANPGLVGLMLHTQVLVDDPAAVQGISMSTGRTLRFGL